LALATILVAGAARAQDEEGTRLSPALEQLRETVSDRLQTAAEDMGLTAEQRDKIREIHAGFAAKYEAQRDARRQLRQDEFKELSALLTPEQREKVKDAVTERTATIKEGSGKRRWPEVACLCDTMKDRIESAADELELTAAQRDKIREAYQPFAQKYREQLADHRKLVEDELRADAEVLSPAQRAVVRRYVEGRIVRAAAAETVADRLRASADRLVLTSEQREKIRDVGRPYAEKFRELHRQRRALLAEEMRAIGNVLTPEQREKARDMREDRVVVIGIEFDPANPPTLAQVREMFADRLNAAADELSLTADQRDKIREIRNDFAGKYRAQRAARRELRQDELRELGAILTPDQRDQVKSFDQEREDTGNNR
jgi:Spy/CpxP family protein refolding chaperone